MRRYEMSYREGEENGFRGGVLPGPTTVGNLRLEDSEGKWVTEAGKLVDKVRVDRGTLLDNPYVMRGESMRGFVIRAYARMIVTDPVKVKYAQSLRGSRLMCWCSPKPCHAHVVKMIADGNDPEMVLKYVLERLR
jgi:hypothetical protein